MSDSESDGKVWTLSIHTSYSAAGLIEELLPPDDFMPSSFVNDVEDTGRVDFYYDSEAEQLAAETALRELLSTWPLDADWTLECRVIPRENWAESWKTYFKPERVSPRIIITPPWEDAGDVSVDDIVIEIDPGMAFGTGQHGTTRACLQFLDQLATDRSGQAFLDIGCGTGVLSLAALRLGLGPVTAIDLDEQAVSDTRRHLARYELDADVRCCRLEALSATSRWPIVAANILAPVLMSNANTIAALCQEGGRLMLSGILLDQYQQVKSCFEALGFKQIDDRVIGEWHSGLFEAPIT